MPVTLTCPRCLKGLDDPIHGSVANCTVPDCEAQAHHPFVYPTHVRITRSRATHLFKDGEIRRVVKWDRGVPYIDLSDLGLYKPHGFSLVFSTWEPMPQ